jgi:putative membrane protein
MPMSQHRDKSTPPASKKSLAANLTASSSKTSASKKAVVADKKPPLTKQRLRQRGHNFEPSVQGFDSVVAARRGKTFKPQQPVSLAGVPESITAGERLPHIAEYSNLKLEALPIKGLRSFTYAVAVVLIVIFGWQLYALIMFVLEQHWLIATALAVLLSTVVILSVGLVINFFKNKEGERALAQIRWRGKELKQSNNIKHGRRFIDELSLFYADKPHAIHLQRCISSLPDYSNDREILAHVDTAFLRALDQEALRRVSRYSAQTGVAVAVSSWAIVDMMLALWRSIKMIDDVAQTYGMRPSKLNRFKLLKKVLHQLAFVAVSEVLLDELLEQMGLVTIVGIASTRLAQGLGASAYTAKIGIAAMQVSRPCELSNKQINLSSILPAIATNLRLSLTKNK